MNKTDIYKSIVIVSMTILIVGTLFGLSSENSNKIFDYFLDFVSLTMAISVFLWKPNKIIAVGAIVYIIKFNIDIYEKTIFHDQFSMDKALYLMDLSFKLFIVSIIIIGVGWWRESQMNPFRSREMNPFLTIIVVSIISLGTQYVLRLF